MAIQQLTTLVTCFSIYHTPHFESFSYLSWSFHAKFERYFFFSWPHWKSRPVCECFLYRIFYVLISPHNIFLPEQNNAIYFRVMASRLPTLLLYSTLPNCQMIFYFFFHCSNQSWTYFNFKLQNIKYERRLFYAFYTAVNTSWHKVYFCWNWYDIVDSQSLQSGRTVRYPSLQNFCLARHSVLLQ